MALSQTQYGKAFEYACLLSLQNHLIGKTTGAINIVISDAYNTARDAFVEAGKYGISLNLTKAANAAIRSIIRLEPQLEYGNGDLTLEIQTDAKGIAGDVRDVVCVRNSTGWGIGLSCKHNHHAVKHSRLSDTIDFGNEWFSIPCSSDYFNDVVPIFAELRDMKEDAITKGKPIPLWKDLSNKEGNYYIPILQAFLDEMKRLVSIDPNVPGKLIHYMLGRYDFYKIITDDNHKTTRVEAINLAGTLNMPANGHHSIVSVAKLKLPTRFYHMGMVPGSNNSIEIVCDEGWSLKMRIHNASSKVEPSLKFDVQLQSLPSSIHAQVEPW